MKKSLKMFVVCVFALGAFVSFAAATDVYAAEVTELNITSPEVEVYAGPLLSYSAATTTEHISIEDYGSNTIWVYWPENGSAWQAFGGNSPEAVDDGVTRYGMRLKLDAEEGYEITSNPTVFFNSANITASQYTVFNKYDWGGYLFIDLGVVSHSDQTESMYTLTFDFNGGATFNGKGTVSWEMAAVGMEISEPNMISCFEYDSENDECHAVEVLKGKALDYVTVNGETYRVEDSGEYYFNQNTTIKYYWTDVNLEEYEAHDEEGNSVTFEEEEGHEYTFEVIKYSFNMTDEELEEKEIDLEEYEAGKAAVMALTNEYGEVVAFYEFDVYDENGRYIHQGPFEVSILFTEDMEGYELYQLVYINMDDEENMYTEEPIDLTLVDGYLVGVVPHFSGYALVGGDAPKAPDTGVAPIARTASVLPVGFCFCYLFAFAICFVVVIKSDNKQ
ncbi:hypothetical protein IKT18_03670 [Candidatus Saccharibacteria bacterium]|nr:hypothetical protein [Candidatus Saccharibacteria bacterium]